MAGPLCYITNLLQIKIQQQGNPVLFSLFLNVFESHGQL